MAVGSVPIQVLLVVSICGTAGCGFHILGDEGEWLGEKIGEAAMKLRESQQTELVLAYKPSSGINQNYYIGIGRSPWPCSIPCYDQSCLTVAVERGRSGSTTYHKRYVAVPTLLEIHKNGQMTQIVLRKNKEAIELVQLR